MPIPPQLLAGHYGRAALLDLGERIVEHAHPHAHVLIKLEGPDSSFTVAGQCHPVRDDTVVTIDPWVPHAGPAQAASAGTTRILVLYLDLPGSADEPAMAPRRAVFHGPCGTLDPELRRMALALRDRMADASAAPDEVDALLQALLATHGERQSERLPRAQMDFRIRRVLRQMQADPRFAQDVNACASVACLSRSHFFHLFRESTGVSPQLFFNALRLEAAIERLGSSSLPIGAVAEQLGFSAAGHFTRFFLHHTGSTPRAYRQGVLQRTAMAGGRTAMAPM